MADFYHYNKEFQMNISAKWPKTFIFFRNFDKHHGLYILMKFQDDRISSHESAKNGRNGPHKWTEWRHKFASIII